MEHKLNDYASGVGFDRNNESLSGFSLCGSTIQNGPDGRIGRLASVAALPGCCRYLCHALFRWTEHGEDACLNRVMYDIPPRELHRQVDSVYHLAHPPMAV